MIHVFSLFVSGSCANIRSGFLFGFTNFSLLLQNKSLLFQKMCGSIVYRRQSLFFLSTFAKPARMAFNTNSVLEVCFVRYTREDGCRAWLLHGLMRPETLSGLLGELGCAEAVYDGFLRYGSPFLKERRVSDMAIAALREHASADSMHEMMIRMQKLDVGVLHTDDARYPDLLRNVPNPPPLLFYRGDLDCLMGKCITIVGSRTASPKGLEVTRSISRELSRAGVTIVSGLAMGIDAAAHEGCLEGGSPTAAILACGMDVDYPAENLDLRERIVHSGGVLLSEYPFGMRANKFVFAARNRIMSGLSRAVLMMESRIRSGSMLTVHHALDQGRDVYAYPGVPGTEWAEGAHQLLREGAIYFTSAQDVLEDLGWLDDAPAPTPQQKQALPPMSDEQRQLYTLLSRGEMSFDELAAESGLPIPTLSVSLTMLQMMGLIKAMPGKSYCRA